MLIPIVVVGCGGFGRETRSIIRDINEKTPTWDFLGYIDDSPNEINLQCVKQQGSRVLGPVEWLTGQNPDIRYVIGIGNPQTKKFIENRLLGRLAATLVHPSSVIAMETILGQGSIICPNAYLSTNVRVGRHVHINAICTIGHDAVLDDYVSVNPAASISGWVKLKQGALVGTNATVLQNLEIGRNAVVGASACVVRDVPDATVAKGVPARWSRQISNSN